MGYRPSVGQAGIPAPSGDSDRMATVFRQRSFANDTMILQVILGTLIPLGLGALAIFVVFLAWKHTRRGNGSPGRSAAIRAAVLTGIFAPAILPGVHGVLPLPSGLAAFIMVMNVLTGEPVPEHRGEGLVLMLGFPTIVFIVLWGVFLKRAEA